MKVSDTSYKIGDWSVEPELLQISRKGEVRKLEFRMMEILMFLVKNKGDVVSKQRLHDEVWKEVYVTDNALTRTVSKLRKVLGDDALDSKYIDTISKSGYRLVASVSVIDANDSKLNKLSRKKWVWGVAAALLIGVFTSMSISSADVYAGFHDPMPISTLVGPELAHDISPNGDKICFTYVEPGTNSPNVYVKLLEDLSQVKFTNLESPQGYGIWSPDGNYMAYASLEDGTCGIYIQPGIGGEKKRVGDCFTRPEDFAWSPDGNTIAFSDYQGEEKRRIYLLNVKDQTTRELLAPQKGLTHRDPSFTSDGRFIVFRKAISGQGADIFKMELETEESTQLTFDNSRIFGLDVFDDDRQVVFSSNRGGQWALWRTPLNGGPITRLFINDRILLEPKFSADDNRLIYKSVTDQTQIWEFRQDSSFIDPIGLALSTRTDMHPSLSTDGNKLAFLSNRSGFFEIWVANLETGQVTKMTSLEGSFVNMPSWSPDGTEIVYDARTNEGHAIYVLDVASRMVRNVIDLEGDQLNAHYSSDGKSIYFASNHSGNWQIWNKSLTTEEVTQLTRTGGFHLQEGHDNQLYYTRSDTSGIWRLNDGDAELFVPQLSTMEWGSWAPVAKGIVYVDRSRGPEVYFKSYHVDSAATFLFKPPKRVQFSTPTLSVSADGERIILSQIELSEDELMMVEF